jgi:hypothetical protein
MERNTIGHFNSSIQYEQLTLPLNFDIMLTNQLERETPWEIE